MKNKIIKLAILSLTIFAFMVITCYVVKAWTGSNVGQKYKFSAPDCVKGSSTLCFSTVPSPKYNRDNEVSGVRITIVDERGNRKSESADFIRNGVILNNPQILQPSTLKIDNSGLSTVKVLGKYTRNEIFYGSFNIREEAPVAYYLPSLPNIIENNDNNDDIRRYFMEMYTNDGQMFMQILNIIRYGDYVNGYRNITSYDQIDRSHYMLVEPLTYISYQYYGTRPVEIATYGTATETFKILVTEGYEPNYNVYGKNTMATSIHVKDAVRNGINRTTTAGLASIQYISSGDWRDYYLDKTINGIPYGVSSGHFWLGDTDCNVACGCGVECPPNNPEETNCAVSGMTIDLSSNCTTNTQGKIADTSNWACIYRQPRFGSSNTYEGQFYQHEDNLDNNPYCNIACKEEITYYYPKDGAIDVYAGHRFTIGSASFYANAYDNTENLTVLGPIRVVGVKTCRTAIPSSVSDKTIKETTNDGTLMAKAYIDLEKFKTDYANANIAVEKAWDNYQVELAKKAAVDGAHTVTGSTTGTHTCTKTKDGDCKTPGAPTTCTYGGKLKNGRTYGPNICVITQTDEEICSFARQYGAASGAEGCKVTRSGGGCSEYNQVTKSADECGDGNFEHDGHKNYTITTSVSGTYSYTGKYYSWSGTDTYTKASCGDGNHGAGHSLSYDIDNTYKEDDYGNKIIDHRGTKQLYEDAVAYRDGLLKQLLQCNNYYDDYSELDPEINFNYLGTANGIYSTSAKLIKNLTGFKVESAYNGSTSYTTRNYGSDGSSVLGSKLTIKKKTCSTTGEKCEDTDIIVPGNNKVETKTTIQYDYSLDYTSDSDLYRFVDKYGVSTTKYNISANKTEYAKEYTDIGYPNFPISYETKTGSYNYNINLGANKFGKEQKYTKFENKINSTLRSVNKTTIPNSLSYTCEFNVKNCILQYCPPRNLTCTGPCCDGLCDIQVIYRPISLTDPFPYQDGLGRDPGNNWSGVEIENGVKTTLVDKYITNNRNVDTYEVYSLKPMYQFVLNSANMRAIRSYNNTQESDYNDFNLTCNNGKYCKSQFLQEGISKGYFKFTNENPNGGVCFNATESDWESCRIEKPN